MTRASRSGCQIQSVARSKAQPQEGKASFQSRAPLFIATVVGRLNGWRHAPRGRRPRNPQALLSLPRPGGRRKPNEVQIGRTVGHLGRSASCAVARSNNVDHIPALQALSVLTVRVLIRVNESTTPGTVSQIHHMSRHSPALPLYIVDKIIQRYLKVRNGFWVVHFKKSGPDSRRPEP